MPLTIVPPPRTPATQSAPCAIAKAAKTRKLHRIPVSPRGRRGIYRRCRRVAQVAAFLKLTPSPPLASERTAKKAYRAALAKGGGCGEQEGAPWKSWQRAQGGMREGRKPPVGGPAAPKRFSLV
jgi:hypothetical protein